MSAMSDAEPAKGRQAPPLDLEAEIDEAGNAEVGDLSDIGLRERAEIVGAEQAAPARAAAGSGGIAAEVAEIDGAFEGEAAGESFGHRRAITRPAGSRMSYSI